MQHDAPIGVIFDMDGVLIDSARPHFESWRMLAAEQGTTVTEAQFGATFGRQNNDIIPLLFGAVDADDLARLADRKEALYRDLVREDPPLVPGASALLAGLSAAGAQLAIGSSGPMANIQLVVEALGAQEWIRSIVSGDDVTRGKPDPQVFEMAARRLSLPPGRCVVIEDAPVGIQAAKAAGAKAIAVLLCHPADAFDRNGAHAPDLIVPRLTDLTTEQVLEMVR